MKHPQQLFHAASQSHIVMTDDGWRHPSSPLPKDAPKQHLNGGPRYGVPFVRRTDQTVMAAMVDIDDHDGALGWAEVQRRAGAVMAELAAHGLAPHPFRSGGGAGINIWVVWEAPQQAAGARVVLNAAVVAAGLDLRAGVVEVFPKQDEVGEGELGSAAALPRTPLDVFDLDDTTDCDWQDSQPVVAVSIQRPSAAPAVAPDANVDELLEFVANAELDYDSWWRVIMAIHAAGGTLEQAEAWSAKSSKYKPGYLPRKWRSIKGVANSLVTVRTLQMLAREGGWGQAVAGDFPVAEVSYPDWYAKHEKGLKKGLRIADIEQVSICFERDPRFPWRIVHDDFIGEILMSSGEILQDEHYVAIRRWFQRDGWESVSKELVRDVVRATAMKNRVDSLMSWVGSLEWDGVSRVGQMVEALRIGGGQYQTAVVRYILSGMVGRAMEPGCQLDMVPVLVGFQGARKTSTIEALSPDFLNFLTYSECSMSELIDRDTAARIVRGKAIILLDELRGMQRQREQIKAAITRRIEEHTPKYVENRVSYKRRCVLIGTTNDDEFLDDPTGARRYLPLKVNGVIDDSWIAENRDQIWAEGREIWRRNGVEWQAAQSLAREVHDAHTIQDSWESLVFNYLRGRGEFCPTHEIFTFALNRDIAVVNRADQMRLAAIMKRLNWRPERATIDGERQRGFCPTSVTEVGQQGC